MYLDEPTVGLDPRQIIEVRNLIKSLAGQHTIILSTHILPEVSMTCDRVTIVNRGKVVATNTPNLLMTQFKDSFGYEVEIEGETQKAIACLQEISGVNTVEIERTLSDGAKNRTVVQITCTQATELGKEIASTVVNQGLGLLEMRRIRLSLEDIFLQLTTEESTIAEDRLDCQPITE